MARKFRHRPRSCSDQVDWSGSVLVALLFVSTTIANYEADTPVQPNPGQTQSTPKVVPHTGKAQPHAHVHTDNEMPPVAVLNFSNVHLGDGTWDWLGKGLADMTIGDLSGQGLPVVSREQMQSILHELELQKKIIDPQAAGRVMKVFRCVHGTYRINQGQAHLAVSIIEVASGKQTHRADVRGPVARILDLQKELAAELVNVLKGSKPGTLKASQLPRWTESLKTTELLYRGIDLYDKGEYLTAWSHFRRSLQRDLNYADAHYWSAKMMYYLQEYHQATPDLEHFALRYATHPRVGDAVMELINSVQTSAENAEEVLRVLKLAGQINPRAEVPNQFGSGYSSTLGIYTAGLAAQILRSEHRYKEAFERYLPTLNSVKIDQPMYWIAWNEMFYLRLEHLRRSGELLKMPSTPPQLPRDPMRPEQGPYSAGGMHPLRKRGELVYRIGGLQTGGDEPIRQEFISLSPAQPTVLLDFRKDPLTSTKDCVFREACTYTRFFYVPSGQYLRELKMELQYRPDPDTVCEVFYEGDVNVAREAFDGSGVHRTNIRPYPGSRCIGVRLAIQPRKLTKNPVAVTAWKITGVFDAAAPKTASVVMFASGNAAFAVKVDGKQYSVAQTTLRVDGLTPGKHLLEILGSRRDQKKTQIINLQPGQVFTKVLYPGGRPMQYWDARPITTPYETFRMSALLGSPVGERPREVSTMVDNRGRWLAVWTLRRDLYLTISDDQGKTWAATRRLPGPVNSAHDELFPAIMQADDGRFVLSFVSDRNLQHAHRPYICWSDDLENFSAPVMMTDLVGVPVRTVQRRDGTFLSYFYALSPAIGGPRRLEVESIGRRDRWLVTASTNLYEWSAPEHIFPAGSQPGNVRLDQPPAAIEVARHGEKIIVLSRWGGKLLGGITYPHFGLYMHISDDGIHLGKATSTSESTIPYPGAAPLYLQMLEHRKKLYAVAVWKGITGALLCYNGGNKWDRVASLQGIPDEAGHLWASFIVRPENNELYCFTLTPSASVAHRVDAPTQANARDFSRRLAAPPLKMVRYEYQGANKFPELQRMPIRCDATALQLSEDGRRFFLRGYFIRGWELESEKQLLTWGIYRWIGDMKLSKNGEKVLIAHAGMWSPANKRTPIKKQHVSLRDVATGRELASISIEGGGICSVSLSPDERLAAVGITKLNGANADAIQVWDLVARKRLAQFPTEGISSARFGVHGKLLAVSSAPTRDLRLWDIGTQREICKLTQPSMVRETRFTADGKRLLVSAGLTQLWEIASGKRLWTKGNSVETLAISHDNKLVAGGSHYGEVIIRELDTGKEITRYNGHEGRITAVAFTADNRRVVSAGTMGTVRVWQLP